MKTNVARKNLSSWTPVIQRGQATRPQPHIESDPYAAFSQLNGYHPLQDQVPEACILYPVKQIKYKKVLYFNFDLAKEMGLIPKNHPHQLNPSLSEVIGKTFSIQIINEYDQKRMKGNLPPATHMATRYLQIQHPNKKGKTSGDGRSVWNGIVKSKINGEWQVWDVSSRGTGVTSLAPGAVEAGRPLKTGGREFGYGCGQAEISELIGSCIMSEIFHRQGINTERMLAIIDLGRGYGIGVRAAPNLIRPAHIFTWLKQKNWHALKRLTDHFINRQTTQSQQLRGSLWSFSDKAHNKYDLMLKALSIEFAEFCADLERHYIFTWIEWDGDNILASPGIIDYGSIRQFGLRHDEYRYDDVDRYSTTLNEQKVMTRQVVQLFAQATEFIKSKKYKPLNELNNHPSVLLFDRIFSKRILEVFLKQTGLLPQQVENLLRNSPQTVDRFYRAFSALERTKVQRRLQKVPDGVHRPAIYRMRHGLKVMADRLLSAPSARLTPHIIPAADLHQILLSPMAPQSEKYLPRSTFKRRRRTQDLLEFQKAYNHLIETLDRLEKLQGRQLDVAVLEQNCRNANPNGRITGNSAEFVTQEVLRAYRRGISHQDLQTALDMFIQHQAPRPQATLTSSWRTQPHSAPILKLVQAKNASMKLVQRMLGLTLDNEDDI